jgi:SAM-dependent methyltransferase
VRAAQPDADAIARDRASEHYRGDRGAAYTRTVLHQADAIARLAHRRVAPHVRQADVVVDFGCGTGHLLSLLDAREKLGIEVNAANRAVAATLGIETVARPEDVPSEYADVIVSHHALEHALHPLAELLELRRIVKPDGRLVLWLPIDDWRVQRRPVRDKHHHLYTWTPRVIANLLSEARFAVTKSRVVPIGYPGRFTPPLADRLPPLAFDAVCVATAVVLRRRQMMTLARPV